MLRNAVTLLIIRYFNGEINRNNYIYCKYYKI